MAIFDPDNIHDRLLFDRIDSRIKGLINSALGNHFPDLEAIWFLQRWHVYQVPWAENWAELVFEFLKPLTRTHLLTNAEINGEAYGFDPQYTADLPENLNLADFPSEVTLKVYKNQTVSISWIERSHNVTSAPYCGQVKNEITCWHRSGRVYTAHNEDLEVKLDSSSWLINSVVIQGDGLLIGITNKQKELMLYQYLDQTLENIYGQLNLTDCKVLTGCDVTPQRQYGNPIFEAVPDHYHFAYLDLAGGGEIGNSPIATVEGNKLALAFGIKWTFFDNWREGLNGSPTGYDFISDNPDFWNPKILQLTIPGALGEGNDISLFTTQSNHSSQSTWDSIGGFPDPNDRFKTAFFVYSALPRLEDNWRLETFNTRSAAAPFSNPDIPKECSSFRFKHQVETNLNFEIPQGENGYDFSAIGVDYYTLYDDFKNSHYDYGIFYKNNPYFTNILERRKTLSNDEYPITPAPVVEFEKWGYTTRFDSIVVPFLGNQDYNLFAKGQVALIRPYTDLKYHLNEVLWGYRDWGLLPQTPDGISSTEITIKRIVGGQVWLIDVDITDPMNAVISHQLALDEVTEEIDLPTDFNYPPIPESTTLESITPSFSLKRTFRNNYVTSVVMTNSVTIDPDPDPDKGDIMPDSQRIIEIHEALDAGKYSKDEQSPNNRRVANLGWLLNKVSHVLGLHFKSNGEMVKPPDTKHVKQGDKIPENWQLYQFGKNNWTQDGVTHEGVGIAYEVRSNSFSKDMFGNVTIDEGGYVLCNSFFQYLECKFDDDDRAFGLQDMGASILPKADGTGYITYQGLHTLVMEIAYMLSAMSVNTAQSHVLGLKAQAMLQEVLYGQGLPITTKEITVEIAGQSVKIPYSAIQTGAASLVDFSIWNLSNQALPNASQLALKENN